MTPFQHQFKQQLMRLDKYVKMGLTAKQLLHLCHNLSPQDFLANLKINARAEKIRVRPVKLKDDTTTTIPVPLLVLSREHGFVLLIQKQNQNWLLTENDELIAFSNAHDIQCALQFYPDSSLSSLTDLLRFFLEDTKWDWQHIVVVSLMLTIFAAITPISFTAMLNTVIPFHDVQLWVQITGLLFVIVLLSGGFELIKKFFLLQIVLKRGEQAQARLWNKLLRFHPYYFSRYSIMNMVIAAQSMDEVRDTVDLSLISHFFTLIFTLTLFTLLFYYSTTLAFLTLLLLTLMLVVAYFFYKIIHHYLEKAQQARIKLAQFTLEIIKGIDKIKLAHAQQAVVAKWFIHLIEKKKFDVGSAKHINTLTLFMQSMLALISFSFYGVFLINMTFMSLSDFIGFTVTYGIIMGEIMSFIGNILTLLLALTILKRAKIITDNTHLEQATGIRPQHFRGMLTLNRLTIDIDDHPILAGIHLNISPGSTTALVGLSGSGKTTLLRSLVGLVEPPTQTIFIDNIALENLNLQWYRMHCGVILQNSMLIDGSIFDNISLGDDFELATIEALCAELHMTDWLSELPMGLHTRCMGAQVLVSGGQKQLILLARALIRKPKFLFLDEATSALDATSQKAVIKFLQRVPATKIIIAHRLETIQWADTILMMEEGKIIEEGRYDQLLAQKGAFFTLAQHQTCQDISKT
ncbi:MAG TPA: hypothetical protein DCG13_00090 [Legionellales bacterium]|nr:hypothetical protein [Legionellales bacterium]HCA90259.1 hypothetical protein [Legionellales bacterium]|tara:strand:- start:1114 stop:3186 length:2073 start_codon:yes stop_codon:yes gene_type:complete